MADNALLLNRAMDMEGIRDHNMRAGIAAICMGESALSPHSEVSYAHTSNDRIRMIFRSRLGDASDQELDDLKGDPAAFFEQVYGGMLGNDQDGDGYKYRGRGFPQLTGKANYERYGTKIGVDLVANPDLANDPAISAEIVIAYMKDRYHGGQGDDFDFDAMKRCVGNNTADINARKDALFERFEASGEFDYGTAAPFDPPVEQAAQVEPQPHDDGFAARVMHWLGL